MNDLATAITVALVWLILWAIGLLVLAIVVAGLYGVVEALHGLVS